MKRTSILFFLSIIFIQSANAQYRFYIYEESGEYNIAPWFRYNKTDGLFTGLGGQYFFNEDFWISARAGYAFSLKKPRYQIGVEKIIPAREDDYYVKLDYYRLTFSGDYPVIPDWQNSLASAIARLDYYDHYDKHGAGAVFGKNWRGTFETEIIALYDRYSSLETETQKSLFRWGGEKTDGKRQFAPNPPVKPGNDVFTGLRLDYDPRPSPMAFLNAWLVRAEYDNSKWLHKLSGSDFRYHRASLSVQRLQRMFTRQKLTLSLSAKSFEGPSVFYSEKAGAELPREQFLYDLGGLNTLRGYRYKEFSNGNRMILGKMDYYFNGSFLPSTPFAKWWGIGWLFKKFDLVLFADAGQSWKAEDDSFLLNPDGFRASGMMYDAGAGLAMGPWLRFDAAFPLKKSRLTKKFDEVYYFTLNINL